jgi:hypothetical protein
LLAAAREQKQAYTPEVKGRKKNKKYQSKQCSEEIRNCVPPGEGKKVT